MKYYYADVGNFWDCFPACIITGRKYYEAFLVISFDSFGAKINQSKEEGMYYERGLLKDLERKIVQGKIREVPPSFFSILTWK